ncbi:MAG: carbonic anhydrase [Pseudomonadota bacterium]|nr:carbonic anhydrase [Desulfobacterales bacterium]MBL6968465.1 carbonic anhydrase [Desulfobacteraceae bacterium]MBL7101566.1 carbonic anhydrase [Desulfobacteraceae bacterium]
MSIDKVSVDVRRWGMGNSGCERITGDQALERLLSGNRRYRDARPKHPNQTPDRRRELEDEQHPFAVILGCSDSRVPPEVIFDQGLGDLFIIRVAGNVVDNMVLGSIQYAVSYLRTPLIMVLAHANCGAVSATLSAHHPLEGQLSCLTNAIQPAVDLVRDQPGDTLNRASKANAEMVAERLRNSKPVLFDSVRAGMLTVAAAYYNLGTGGVEILSQ